MTTTYMSLDLPAVSVTLGPAWATKINTAITSLDSHTHAPGFGAPVPSSGLALSSDVSFNYSGSVTGNNATGLRTTRFVSQAAKPADGADKQCLYVRDAQGNLYFIDGGGNDVKITSGGALNSSALTNNAYTHISKAINYTILSSDTSVVYYVDTTAGNIDITLPLANAMDGKFLKIKHSSGSNYIRVLVAGGDVFDNTLAATAVYIYPGYGMVTFYSDGGTVWYTERDGHDLNGAKVTTSAGTGTALTIGKVLQVTGATTVDYGPIDLTGGGTGSSNYYTGRLPSANMFQATTGVEGIVKLANDFAGTSLLPEVTAVTGAAGVGTIRCATLSFASGVVSPIINQPSIAGAGTGLSIAAQASTGAGGGSLTIGSGMGSAANGTNAGDILIKRGTISHATITGSSSSMTMTIASPGASASGLTFQLAGSNANTSGNGGIVAVTAGDGTGSNKNGGDLVFRSGTATGTGLKGSLSLKLANSSAVTMAEAGEVASGRHVLSLLGSANSTNVPSGDMVLFLGNATTAPSSNPANGCVLWIDNSSGSYRLHIRYSDGATGIIPYV